MRRDEAVVRVGCSYACQTRTVGFTVTDEIPAVDELVELYRTVGWTAYAADPARLLAAVRASHTVLTARSETGTLIGLLRTVSDGLTIVYIQDILITPSSNAQASGARSSMPSSPERTDPPNGPSH